ncbi:hypothetical protein E2C01_058061 [Portunus trituberculatus]|uniref:Uncharacterized protein n=1 Tax=Portunus trituberculatus TaxID=210409 RepID=A0A5B7H1N2_PORTR|nr:hypothetical protein [Portunus trituberculatus]
MSCAYSPAKSFLSSSVKLLYITLSSFKFPSLKPLRLLFSFPCHAPHYRKPCFPFFGCLLFFSPIHVTPVSLSSPSFPGQFLSPLPGATSLSMQSSRLPLPAPAPPLSPPANTV